MWYAVDDTRIDVTDPCPLELRHTWKNEIPVQFSNTVYIVQGQIGVIGILRKGGSFWTSSLGRVVGRGKNWAGLTEFVGFP